MLNQQQTAKLVISPYKNALPIKFTLKPGVNSIGSNQEHNICINNRQIVDNHCNIIMHPNEIELIVLDGPVYVKNEDSEYELLAKNSALILNSDSQDFQFRLGKTIEAKIQGLINEYTFNLQERLSNLKVNIVESQYANVQEVFEEQKQQPLITEILEEKETPHFSKKVQSEVKKKSSYKQTTLDNFCISPKTKKEGKVTKEISKEGSRMSHRKKSRWNLTVAFSGFRPTRQEQQFLLTQNVQICQNNCNFNLLVIKDFVSLRSVKLLIALAKGLPIVSKEWLNKCIEKFQIVEQTPYLAKFSNEFCEEYKFNPKKYMKRMQKSNSENQLPLQNVQVLLPKDINYHLLHEELEKLIIELGGKVLDEVNTAASKDIVLLIPRELNELSQFKDFKQTPIENLFQSVLQYKNML